MPYCCQCGNPAGEADRYCARCGAPQPAARPIRDLAAGLSPRTASILCYIPWVGWIVAIAVLASNAFRQNRTVRFHAFQGLYLFVGWLLIQWVLKPLAFFTHGTHFSIVAMLEVAIVGLWIFMMVKTSHEEHYSLPVIGELAEKSLSE